MISKRLAGEWRVLFYISIGLSRLLTINLQRSWRDRICLDSFSSLQIYLIWLVLEIFWLLRVKKCFAVSRASRGTVRAMQSLQLESRFQLPCTIHGTRESVSGIFTSWKHLTIVLHKTKAIASRHIRMSFANCESRPVKFTCSLVVPAEGRDWDPRTGLTHAPWDSLDIN